MAENKKSFIMYADFEGMFKALPDDVAGRLVKHIFSYVNDQSPMTDDFMINALFEPIKSSLKRDLIKWESQRNQRSEAGKISAELRKNKSTQHEIQRNPTSVDDRSNSLNEIQRNPTVSVSVSVNDSVSDNVNDILLKKETKFNFKNELLKFGANENLIDEWLLVRKNKRLTNTETAFKSFLREIEKSKKSINEILELCIIKSWGGFEAKFLENLNKNQNGTNHNNSGTSTSEGYKPAKVNVEKLLRELADDVETGNIPGVYKGFGS